MSRERLIKMAVVLERTGLGRGTLYLLMKRGEFPLPANTFGRSVRWPESEVDAWIDTKKDARKQVTA